MAIDFAASPSSAAQVLQILAENLHTLQKLELLIVAKHDQNRLIVCIHLTRRLHFISNKASDDESGLNIPGLLMGFEDGSWLIWLLEHISAAAAIDLSSCCPCLCKGMLLLQTKRTKLW